MTKTLWAHLFNPENARNVQVRVTNDTANAMWESCPAAGLHIEITAQPMGSIPIVQTLWEGLLVLFASEDALPAVRKEVFK